MLAWLGGRRRLMKEQKARKRLQGVFAEPKPADSALTDERAQPPQCPVPVIIETNSERVINTSPAKTAASSLDFLAISGSKHPSAIVTPTLQSNFDGTSTIAASSSSIVRKKLDENA